MEFSRLEYWIVGRLCFLQGILPTQVSFPRSSALQADSLPAEAPGKPIFEGYFVENKSHPFNVCSVYFCHETNFKKSYSLILGIKGILDIVH